MKKKIACWFLVILTLVCLQTATWAAEAEEEFFSPILTPFGGNYTDKDGNIVLNEDGENVPLTADIVGDSDTQVAWCVLDGKDKVSLTKRDGYNNQAILTALADGEAKIAAYLEDDSQTLYVANVIVSNQSAKTVGKVKLTTGVQGSGKIKRMKDTGALENWGSYREANIQIGTQLELIAEGNGQPFLYWYTEDARGARTIVSTSATYQFTLLNTLQLYAMFDASDDGSSIGKQVTFLYNNLLAKSDYILNNAWKVEDIAAPYQRNKQFDKWVSEQVNADTVFSDDKLEMNELPGTAKFTATYTVKPVEININVVGGSGSGTYAYGDAVTATVTDVAQEGKQFLFWSKDGAPVSYDKTYAFSALQDCTITAIFGPAAATDGINMVMQRPVVEGNVIAFTFERFVPGNYTFVSSGFIVGKYDNCLIGDEDNYTEAVSYRAGERTQFTKSLKKISGVTTYYARGYVTYKDGDVLKTVYTPAQKIVVE